MHLRARLLVPVAVVVALWGGLHVLGSHDAAISSGTWPLATSPAAGAPTVAPGAQGVGTGPSPSPSAPGQVSVPVLPAALQTLNGDTRDAAVGLYAIISELEAAVGSHLRQLVAKLEPGR